MDSWRYPLSGLCKGVQESRSQEQLRVWAEVSLSLSPPPWIAPRRCLKQPWHRTLNLASSIELADGRSSPPTSDSSSRCNVTGMDKDVRTMHTRAGHAEGQRAHGLPGVKLASREGSTCCLFECFLPGPRARSLSKTRTGPLASDCRQRFSCALMVQVSANVPRVPLYRNEMWQASAI